MRRIPCNDDCCSPELVNLDSPALVNWISPQWVNLASPNRVNACPVDAERHEMPPRNE